MSCVGFGTVPFSTGQFGITDWAEESLWKTIPLVYREIDPESNTADQVGFLRATVNGYKEPFNELRRFADKIPDQRDPRECDLNMLDLLGFDFFVKPDDYKPDLFRRSSVIHIAQQLLLKGTDKGYKVLGAVEGYIITVEGLWETECDSNVLTDIPPTFVVNLDEVPADMLPLDTDYPDEFAVWERIETFNPVAGTTILTLINNDIRYVHVFLNSVEMPQGAVTGGFVFNGSHTITLQQPSVLGDTYVVHEIDGFPLHNGVDPNPRCRSHSLRLTVSLGPPQGWITPLQVLVERLYKKVKPIHVTFESLLYTIEFPTIYSPTSVTMTSDVLAYMTIEDEKLFDVSPADIEPTDLPFVDMK